jgi:serine/threonine-protein kinase
VALKQILDAHADDEASRRRFLVEAEITGGLEHPGIVPVYGLGTHSDGRPYYAMRFIRGDSLKEAIDRFHADAVLRKDPGRRSLELRRLLRRFTDMCNAIDYAHSRGVLHRDIKPGNVIVGKHGETLVVDWGLAKATGQADPDSGERTLRPASASGSAETLPGSALGTPAYMSPEQAEGDLEHLGPRSDVYSLGASLYCLLTGKPPFAGDAVEVIPRVQRGDFSPPRATDPGIDRALEAVCLKAMAHRPVDRYASPKTLAEDLERWMADEAVSAWREPVGRRARRWMRRHRTLVTSTAAVLIFSLAGLAGFATVLAGKNRQLDDKNLELAGKNRELDARNLELDRQRQRAERRETLAIDAVRKFRDAVEANPELKNRPGLDSLRKALLKEPLAFFGRLRDELQADRDTRPDAVAKLADANYDLARTTEEIGSFPDAIRSYSESIALHERLGRDRPSAASCQYHLAASHNHLGGLFRATGRPKEAMESYQRSAAIFERLARDDPSVVQYQDDQAGCYLNMGNLLRAMGRPAEAIASYRKGLDVFERLARAHPTDTQVQLDLAVSHMNTGNVLSDLGRRAEALASYRRALPIHERLARDNPGVHKFENGLAACLDNIGTKLSAMRRPIEAMASHRRALEIFERLAINHPAVTQFQDDLGMCYMNIGSLNLSMGRPAEALQSFRGGMEVYERLVRDHPSVPNYRSSLGGALNNVAMVEMRRGQWPEARMRLDRAVEHQRAALAVLPRHPVYRHFLRNHLTNLAAVHRALNQPAEAARAVREWADLVRGDPADLYNVACSLALCVPLARGESRQALANEAVDMLKAAVAAGWSDARHTGRDPDLAALRDRPDYQALLAELFDRAFPADPFGR